MVPETNDLEWPRWPSMPVGTGYEAGLRGGPFFVQSPQGSQISDFRTRRFCSTQEPDIAAFPRD